MPWLNVALIAAILAAVLLALAAAAIGGYQLAIRLAAPQRDALRVISELTPEGLKQALPDSGDRLARAALTRIWALIDPVITRQRQLLDQNGELQRRYGQARALIEGGYGLLELKQVELTLEEIFLSLTGSSLPAAASA